MYPSDKAIGIAARIWTEESTKNKVMDTVLCEAMARKIDEMLKLLRKAYDVTDNPSLIREMNAWDEKNDNAITVQL